LDKVHIYYDDKYFGLARIIDLTKQKHKDVQNVEQDPIVTSDASKQYFDNIKSNYQEYLQKQLDEPIKIVDNQVKTPDTEQKNDEDPLPKVPDEKTEVIKRKEFVDIITSSLKMDNLSFAQKGKLYELWQTFKEFNPEYLTSIIDDIKDKSPDYNKNFLYYLAQIKDLYLKKLSKNTKGGQK
jgi:hypothetical protein